MQQCMLLPPSLQGGGCRQVRWGQVAAQSSCWEAHACACVTIAARAVASFWDLVQLFKPLQSGFPWTYSSSSKASCWLAEVSAVGTEPSLSPEGSVNSLLVGFNLAAPLQQKQIASLSALNGRSGPLLLTVYFEVGCCLLCSNTPMPQSPVSGHAAFAHA